MHAPHVTPSIFVRLAAAKQIDLVSAGSLSQLNLRFFLSISLEFGQVETIRVHGEPSGVAGNTSRGSTVVAVSYMSSHLTHHARPIRQSQARRIVKAAPALPATASALV